MFYVYIGGYFGSSGGIWCYSGCYVIDSGSGIFIRFIRWYNFNLSFSCLVFIFFLGFVLILWDFWYFLVIKVIELEFWLE